MSDLQIQEKTEQGWLENMPFVKIFQGFRLAIQPGKLILALSAIVILFAAGGILDMFTPQSDRVVVSGEGLSEGRTDWTELELYVSSKEYRKEGELREWRNDVRQANQRELDRLIEELDEADKKKLSEGVTPTAVEGLYDDRLGEAVEILADHYENREKDIKVEYKANLENTEDKIKYKIQRDKDLMEVTEAYQGIFRYLTVDGSVRLKNVWVDQLIKPSSRVSENAKSKEMEKVQKHKKQVLQAIQWAEIYRRAKLGQGRGIFATFVETKMRHSHRAVKALILEQNCIKSKNEMRTVLLSVCWLIRFHPIFYVFMVVAALLIWAVFGGAICRITAMQFARDERIGPLRALRYSMSKLSSFFSAPLIPIGILILISAAIWIPSLLVAIPWIGEIVGGVLMPLALVGGLMIAIISIALIGGYNLMYPAIAVEGADSFDAISRSFNYVLTRPWRMGFYSAVAAVYGSICYLFVRFFVFLLLAAVHISAGCAINLDDSAMLSVRDKLDAMWPMPTFNDLHTSFGTLNWMGLNWSESLGAFLVWIWISLTAAVVMAFVVSFFFSVNTVVYYLMRHKVDETDMEDIFVEEDVEDLFAEPGGEDDFPQEPTISATPKPESESEAEQKPKQEPESNQPLEEPTEASDEESELPSDEDENKP